MDLSTVLVFLLYGAALVFIIQFVMSKNAPVPVIIQQQPDVVYSDASWWPWSTGSYNYWPYWSGWWSGGGDGGYGFWRRGGPRIHPQPRPRFGGGPRGQLGGSYGPIGIPASRPGGGGMNFGGGRGGMGGGRGGGRR